mgnify:CR=1 FL=1
MAFFLCSACLDQYVSGFQAGDEVQVRPSCASAKSDCGAHVLRCLRGAYRPPPAAHAQAGQAQVVQRIQSGLERLASLGVTAHAALPASIHEMLERGDRPTADAELRTAADQYETAGTGLDVRPRIRAARCA